MVDEGTKISRWNRRSLITPGSAIPAIGLAYPAKASLRFAKGINHQSSRICPLSFSDLLKELAGAHEAMKTSSYDTLKHPVEIDTSLDYLNGRLGTSFSDEEILDVLKRDHLRSHLP
jgi:phenylalanyl-tRNA synthetase beta subunit